MFGKILEQILIRLLVNLVILASANTAGCHAGDSDESIPSLESYNLDISTIFNGTMSVQGMSL